MNTYFGEALTVVQSEQFANEFKSTIKFILRLVNLLFLVIAGLFTLVKEFVCRQFGCKELPKEELPIYDCKEEQETNLEFTNEGSNDGVINEGINVEFTNESINEGLINEGNNKGINEGSNVEFINESTDILTLENQTEVISTENDVDLTVGGINNQLENDKSENDKSIRHKELKQMKATELRQLCGTYSIEYKNKQQAIETIFQFEGEQLQG